MTIICALHDADEGCTWLGSDRQYTMDGGRTLISEPKWVVSGSAAIGLTGTARGGDVIRCHGQALLDGAPDPHELVRRLIDILARAGCMPDTKERFWPSYGFGSIYATTAGVWSLDQGFAVVPVHDALCAEGSGADYAFGAGHAIDGMVPPATIVRKAVEAACAYDAGCGGEPWIHCLR